MADLETNIKQAIADFGAIKQAINDKGVDIPSSAKTSEYSQYISQISGGGSTSPYSIGADGLPSGDVVFPDSMTKINSVLTKNNTNITKVTIPNTITAFEVEQFYGCTSIADIVINGIKTPASRIFYRCNSLTNEMARHIINHLDVTKGAFQETFAYCDGLTDINVSYAGGWTFYTCSKLQSAYVDVLLTDCRYTFGYCRNLKSLTINNYIKGSNNYWVNPEYNNPVANCTSLETLNLPDEWSVTINLSTTTALTHDCIVDIFNKLADLTDTTTQTITLGSTNLAKVSDDEIAIATQKNWTVA